MDFFNLSEKYLDFRLSESAGERCKHGAMLLGVLVANTAIAAGKLTGELVKRLPDAVEKETERVKVEAERRKRET